MNLNDNDRQLLQAMLVNAKAYEPQDERLLAAACRARCAAWSGLLNDLAITPEGLAELGP